MHFRAGTSSGTYQIQQPDRVRLDTHSRIDLVLRSSEAAARRTVDTTSLWMGELVFPNVPVAGP